MYIQIIEDFLILISTTEKEFGDAQVELRRYEQLTQDYLHTLELEATTYHEIAHIALGLSKCRKERRPFKDTVATLEPIVKYARSPKGQAMVAQLTQIANSMRRIEQAQQNRVYHPRVLRSEDLSKKEPEE